MWQLKKKIYKNSDFENGQQVTERNVLYMLLVDYAPNKQAKQAIYLLCYVLHSILINRKFCDVRF